jgi:prenyl protein peptidase
MALVSVAFQFSFTFLFGVLVSVVYLRTGRLVGAVLAHSFCNLVGVPNLRPLVSRDTPPRQRILFIGGYLAGVALFAALLAPLTDPHYFGSRLYALATNKSAP